MGLLRWLIIFGLVVALIIGLAVLREHTEHKRLEAEAAASNAVVADDVTACDMAYSGMERYYPLAIEQALRHAEPNGAVQTALHGMLDYKKAAEIRPLTPPERQIGVRLDMVLARACEQARRSRLRVDLYGNPAGWQPVD